MDCTRVNTRALRVATWNIHNGRGIDGRRDIARIGKVIDGLDAALVGLQEVGCGPSDGCDVGELAKQNGYAWHAVPLCGRGEVGARGNALLTTLPVESVKIHDLSVAGREPRAALEAMVGWHGRPLRVVVTHLGLRAGERRVQVERLLAALGPQPAVTTVLLGDINEWFLWGRPLRWLHKRFGESPAVRSFPSHAPLFALDRIWAEPTGTVTSVKRVCLSGLRDASDHLPVVASLRLAGMSACSEEEQEQEGAVLASSG
jgi:phospholipase D1/2